MRSLIKVVSKLAMASAISQMALENPIDDIQAKEAYQQMDRVAMDALAVFPGTLSNKEFAFVQERLSRFVDTVKWDNKETNVHALLIFNTDQLENMRHELFSHNADSRKITAIDNLINIEASIYARYADVGENPEDNIEGLNAVDVWNEIFCGS
jgi:hypothetical protein